MSEDKAAKAAEEQTEEEQPQREHNGEKQTAAKEQVVSPGASAENAKNSEAAAKEELAGLQEENERLLDSLARLQADFDNYRKRLANEKKEWLTQAVCELIREMLPVIDNLERAMQTEDGSHESLLEGIALIYRQLLDVLGKHGLEVIEACGNEFDPNYHHAVMQVESDQPENTVVEELQKGYKVKGRVLRPSMVKVAK